MISAHFSSTRREFSPTLNYLVECTSNIHQTARRFFFVPESSEKNEVIAISVTRAFLEVLGDVHDFSKLH